MNRSFTIPSCFHPAESLLGRWMRRRIVDRRAAESTYIVAASAITLGLVLLHILTWAYLQPMTEAELSRFLAAEAAVAVVYASVAVVGRRAAVVVHVETEGLRIERGGDVLRVPFREMRRVAMISSQTYHVHYARYAASLVFVNRMVPTLLLIECGKRPVILGLEPAEQLELDRILTEGAESSYPSTHVGAA